jgi:antitoxin component YwqK of YwqJK toxin-antitoxin module
MDYFYTPLRFITLVEGGPDYPEREEPLPPLNERSLLSFSAILRRPSEEFSNATEELELNNGIPVKSTVYYENGKKAAETEYSIGRPLLQRLDLDQDGRMETIRRFERTEPPFRVLSSESDWDGDGIFEYAETLQQDGTVKKSWDLDRDGIRETER